MSQCNAYELLYWDTDRDCVGWKQTIGRQLADDQRDVHGLLDLQQAPRGIRAPLYGGGL